MAAATPTAWQPVEALEGAAAAAVVAGGAAAAAAVGAAAGQAHSAAEAGSASGSRRREQSASVAQCFGVASLSRGRLRSPRHKSAPNSRPDAGRAQGQAG